MAFKILDTEKFIKNVHAKLVDTPKTFNREFEPTPTGLQSKTIFGVTTKEKFQNYGYIDLKTTILHPLVYLNLGKINTVFNKVLQSKEKFSIEEGVLIPSPSGGTGLGWLLENWDKIKFSVYTKDSNKLFIDFIKNTQKNIFIINKIPVIPIAYRESFMGKNKIIESNEIDDMYKKLLNATPGTASTYEGDSDFNNLVQAVQKTQNTSRKDSTQQTVNAIYDYFVKKLEAKSGFFRNTLAAKRLDNVARMVANARPDIPVDCAAIPWHILLNVFDIFVVHYLQLPENAKIAKDLGITEDVDMSTYGDLFDYIYRNVDTYVKYFPNREVIWINVLTEVFTLNPEIRVLLKRDPGWNADSFHCLKPIIRVGVQYEIIVNSIYYSPLGGDSFSSNFLVQEKESNIIYEDDYFVIESMGEESIVGSVPVPTHVKTIKKMSTIYREFQHGLGR